MSGVAPNKRLKLAGGDRFKESRVLAPWRARTFVHYSCTRGRVARSLSAIRWAACSGGPLQARASDLLTDA